MLADADSVPAKGQPASQPASTSQHPPAPPAQPAPPTVVASLAVQMSCSLALVLRCDGHGAGVRKVDECPLSREERTVSIVPCRLIRVDWSKAEPSCPKRSGCGFAVHERKGGRGVC